MGVGFEYISLSHNQVYITHTTSRHDSPVPQYFDQFTERVQPPFRVFCFLASFPSISMPFCVDSVNLR